jgi:DNA-binding transcriptional regulator YdaS (Cro superfamily)
MTRADLVLIATTRAHLADGSARRQRLAAGIRTGEMAEHLGVTPQAVSQWESGRRTPAAVHAIAYAKATAAAGHAREAGR